MIDGTGRFVELMKERSGERNVSVDEIRSFGKESGVRIPWGKIKQFQVDRNVWNFNGVGIGNYIEPVKHIAPPMNVASAVPEVIPEPEGKSRVDIATMTEKTDYLVPEKDPLFVSFGVSADLNKIVKANTYLPVFITGESGIGKTLAVVQACAKYKRELIRFNVTNDTDESDLFGDFRLIDGNMIFCKGPVLEAMTRGAVLLLDEISAGNPNKMLALQSVLEGNAVFIKKIGKKFVPAPGFTIIATDNSKGKGSDSGRYIGLNVLNEAFLDRFIVTLEHTYPNKNTERRILERYLDYTGTRTEDTTQYAKSLVDWSEIIRKTFSEGACEEVISTRRLVNICKLYNIFKDKRKAINLSINRFDEDTIESFGVLFEKLWDGDLDALTDHDESEDVETERGQEIPF